MREFEVRTELDKSFFAQVASQMERVRNAKLQCQALRLQDHPRVLALRSLDIGRPRSGHHSKYEKLVAEIVYRCDPESQFRDVSKVALANATRILEARKEHRLVAAGESKALCDGPPSRDRGLRRPMQDHLRTLCRRGGTGLAFSMLVPASPNSSHQLGTAALPDLLQSPVGRPRLLLPVRPLSNACLRADVGPEDFDDTSVDDVAGGAPTHDRTTAEVHMTVVHAHGSAAHTPWISVGAGRRLGDEDIVVSIHEMVSCLAGSRFVVARPKHVGVSGKNTLGVLSVLGLEPAVLRAHTMSWHSDEKAYCIRGVVADDHAIDLVTRLVSAGAFPCGPLDAKPLEVAKVAEQLHIHERLVEMSHPAAHPDLVQCLGDTHVSSKWALTAKGASQLEMLHVRRSPTPVFELPASVPPLCEMIAYELILHLEAQGFVWHALPSRGNMRKALCFNTADTSKNRFWCSGKAAPSRLYLCALANASVLAENGIQEIHHGREEGYYAALLPDNLKPLRARRCQLQQPNFKLQADAGEAGDLAIADETAAAAAAEPQHAPAQAEDAVSALGPDVANVGQLPGLPGALLEEGRGQASGAANSAELLELAEGGGFDIDEELWASLFGPHGDTDHDAEAEAESESCGSPSAASSCDSGGGDGDDGTDLEPSGPMPAEYVSVAGGSLRPSALNFKWGAFTFTLARTKDRRGNTRYGWQCACPFHRRSETSGCKKRLQIPEGENFPALGHATLCTLKHWANQAEEYSRQRLHLRCPAVVGDHPPLAMLNAQRLNEKPAAPPFSDEYLDLQDAVLEAEGLTEQEGRATSQGATAVSPSGSGSPSSSSGSGSSRSSSSGGGSSSSSS